MAIFIVQTSFKKLEQAKKQTKAMLDSWVNVSANNSPTNKPITAPNNKNTPTYHPPQVGKTGGNNNGEYNWLFGIRQ